MNEGLPDIYEQYLRYLEHTREISRSQISGVKRMLAFLHDYFENHHLSFATLKIEHLDAFMGEFKVAKTTLRIYRYHVRGFLTEIRDNLKIVTCYLWLTFIKIVFLALHIRTPFR